MSHPRPFAITLDPGSSLHNHTGTWRTQRPVYLNRLPPCNNACPAGENIQQWLYHAEEGHYEQAFHALIRDNPFPAIHGRVCYHPCEDACNRGQLDQAVSIHAVERFLGDEAIKQGWLPPAPAPATGKRVLIVGAGPSGLSAAYHLAMLGHKVVIYEAGPLPGGMMRFGIPKYRLPREILDAEIGRLATLGVTIELNRPVADVAHDMAAGGFDACFLAIGAQLSKRTEIPCRDAGKMLDAVSFLRAVESGQEPVRLGRRVAIYGGGNTAMDAARTARRLGAEETLIIYRRDREHMAALEFEADEALQEGVVIRWLRTIKQMDDSSLTVEEMELDKDGWPQPTGRLEKLEADTLILALGQKPDSGFLAKVPGLQFDKEGVLKVDANLMTGYPGLFAGGDMVPGQRSVTIAVGHGKKAARHLDAYLRQTRYCPPPKPELASFGHLNTWYYSDAERSRQPVLDLLRRTSSFTEIHSGLNADTALFEARRCLSCGNCFECDNCYGVCPDNAVIKKGPGNRYEFNYDFCKGCGLCAQECPCGAIAMENEKI